MGSSRAGAKREQFGIMDDENGCLLDNDVYGSEKEATEYARDIVGECDEDTSCTVVKLVPVAVVKRNTAVTTEKL